MFKGKGLATQIQKEEAHKTDTAIENVHLIDKNNANQPHLD